MAVVYKELYRLRKEKIERVFGPDAKEKHGCVYTQYRGLAQVTNWVKLKFAAMNLKKLATWKWKAQSGAGWRQTNKFEGETHKTFRLFSPRRVLVYQTENLLWPER